MTCGWRATLAVRHCYSPPTQETSLGQAGPVIAPPHDDEPRINDRIRAREVRLVGADGEQIGIKPLPEALSIAAAADLDLVEVAAQASPPVCRIMDYGKFKYEAAQKMKESRRKSRAAELKEMKYRPKIGIGDFDTKTRNVEKFLSHGHKVKLTIMFRGREMAHPELGRDILEKVANTVEHVGKVDQYPRLDGRNMTMVLSPDKRAQADHARKLAEAEAQAASAALAAAEVAPQSPESQPEQTPKAETSPTEEA